MTVDVQPIAPTILIAEAEVTRVERLSPAFVRATLTAAAFENLGRNGFDTRFKMVFPGPTGALPPLPAEREEWYASWTAMPPAVKSPMRTYTIRDVLDQDGARLLVVDMAVHEHGPQGPACRWALHARPGDRIQVIAPHRAAREYGGTEFAPDGCRDLLLVADETAVPAVARILADLPPASTGHAFLEVPHAADILPLEAPGAVQVSWLARGDDEHGRRLVERVRRHLGLDPLAPAGSPPPVRSDLDVDVWETPRYSSSGEDLHAAPQRAPGPDRADLYAWIAGESTSVKALRRSLVTELDVDRRQVAFMGYWKKGVAMRS